MSTDNENYEDDSEIDGAVEEYYTHLLSVLTKDTFKRLLTTLKTTWSLKIVEAEFLHIAAKAETNKSKQTKFLNRGKALQEEIFLHVNSIIVDNLFAKYLQKAGKVFDLTKWNLFGPSDPRKKQDPSNHIISLFFDCLDKFPADTEIKEGTQILPISITINLLAPKEAIQLDLFTIESAVLARRDKLKATRPELFIHESKQSHVKKSRGSESELERLNECVSILKKCIAQGKTIHELVGHQPPSEVILEHYKSELQGDTPESSGRYSSSWDTCRQKGRRRLEEALKYLEDVKNHRFRM